MDQLILHGVSNKTKCQSNTCLYPFSNYVSYSHIFEPHQRLLLLSPLLKNHQHHEAICDTIWQDAMKQEIEAFELNHLGYS